MENDIHLPLYNLSLHGPQHQHYHHFPRVVSPRETGVFGGGFGGMSNLLQLPQLQLHQLQPQQIQAPLSPLSPLSLSPLAPLSPLSSQPPQLQQLQLQLQLQQHAQQQLQQQQQQQQQPLHHGSHHSSHAPAHHHPKSPRGHFVKSNTGTNFELKVDNIVAGIDTRTTLMIKNIPNKYSQTMLLEALESYRGQFDFFYLPIDFKNKCNVGYAFINFVLPIYIVPFFDEFDGRTWERFNSLKVCSITYARIQGKQGMIDHFRNSRLLIQDKVCRPLLFFSDGIHAGEEEEFPMDPNYPHTTPL